MRAGPADSLSSEICVFTRLVFLAAVAATVLPVRAADPLTLDQALALATQRSEAVRAARAGLTSARESAQAAGQLPDPVFSVGIDNMPVTGTDRFRTAADGMTMRRLGISQEWLTHGKRALREAAAQAQSSRLAVSAQVALAQVRLQAAQAYLDAYYAGQALALAQQAERHAHEESEAARARLQSATGTAQEALASQVALGLAKDDTAQAEQFLASTLVGLRRWTGRQDQDQGMATPQLPGAPGEAAYLARHPSVLAAQRDLDAARAQARATAANRSPNWTWQLSYGQRAGLADMLSVTASVPWPVSPSQRQDRDTAAMLALADKAQADLEEATRAAAAEYHALARDAQLLQQRQDGLRQAVLAPAQQRAQVAVAGYRGNQVPLAVLFEARHAHLEAQRKLLALQAEHAKALVRLAFTPVPGDAP